MEILAIISAQMSHQRRRTCVNVAFSPRWCPGRDSKASIHAASWKLCEFCAGFLLANALTSFKSQTRCLAPEPGAGGGKPGVFTSVSRAWRVEQCHIAAMCSMVSNSGIFHPPLLCALYLERPLITNALMLDAESSQFASWGRNPWQTINEKPIARLEADAVVASWCAFDVAHFLA